MAVALKLFNSQVREKPEASRPEKGAVSMAYTSQESLRCGIVLAGGEGKRLQPFVYQLRGDRLPKQYVGFIDARSMLEQSFDRAEKLIPAERLFTIASRSHLNYFEAGKQLAARPAHTVILQPLNRETAPGVLLPLMHIYKRFPRATVAVFPSDHFIWEEDLFMAYVELAFQWVEQDPSAIVLMGTKPTQPDPEYGYIVP
jgi:mannose-1-phosphate guanylyltransferase